MTAQGVTYTYDGLGNRVEKSNGTLYWYGPGGEVLDETNLTGSLTNEYVFFAGKRVARRDSSGNIYYYAEDFIGSSRVITQSNGTLCSDADFLPFGQEVDFTSACGQNYKFEGKERDIETGNDNFGARYYRSALGRWMSPDWSAIPAPVPYANLTNPQTLNLYAMTSDNPETFADLDGHEGILAMIADPGGSLSPDMVTGSDFLSEGTGTISANSTPPPEPQQPTATPQSPTGVAAQQQSTASPLKDKNGNVVLGASGQPALIPSGFDVNAVIKAGKSDAGSVVHKAEDLTNFRRGGKWDLQRLGGKFDPRFVDSATIVIGMYAASADITRKHILTIENDVAIRSHYAKGTQMDSTYTHLPVRNVTNTDIGMRLVLSGAIP